MTATLIAGAFWLALTFMGVAVTRSRRAERAALARAAQYATKHQADVVALTQTVAQLRVQLDDALVVRDVYSTSIDGLRTQLADAERRARRRETAQSRAVHAPSVPPTPPTTGDEGRR